MSQGLIDRIAAKWLPGRVPSPGGPVRSRSLANVLDGGNRRDQLGLMGAVGTLFSIVDRTSSSFSQIEWGLYRSAPSGRPEDRVEVRNHLAVDLWRRPNDFHSGMMLREMGQQHFHLTGETWIVVDRDDSFRDIPLGLWTVRPDRIEPVPGKTTFLDGYVYTSEDGEQIPLQLDEVLSVKRPSPIDPYRGIGAVQSTILEHQTAHAVAEWNRNFFTNGAMPGGVIEIPNQIDDVEFADLLTRWREAHRGVSRAHRVGVLEHGATFNATTYSVKDLMVTELRGMTRDAIMESFGISKHMLGITEDVNRANAEAGEYIYAKYVDRPAAVRWREMLNVFYLPLFGPTATGLEWDFRDPVPEDAETAGKAFATLARAAKDLADAGWEPDDIVTATGLPPMKHTGVVPIRRSTTDTGRGAA